MLESQEWMCLSVCAPTYVSMFAAIFCICMIQVECVRESERLFPLCEIENKLGINERERERKEFNVFVCVGCKYRNAHDMIMCGRANDEVTPTLLNQPFLNILKR